MQHHNQSKKFEPFQYYALRRATFRTRQEVAALKLQGQIEDFLLMYHPAKGKKKHIPQYLEYARRYGVYGLRIRLNQKYGVNFDEIDTSDAGWRVFESDLEGYLRVYAEATAKEKFCEYKSLARKEGIYICQSQLAETYAHTLQEYQGRSLLKWKKNWSSLLLHVNTERIDYELARFFNFIQHTDHVKTECIDLDSAHEEVLKKSRTLSRDQLNHYLLKTFQISLDDVPMIKGATSEERQLNLTLKLTSFHQRYKSDVIKIPEKEILGDIEEDLIEVASIEDDQVNHDIANVQSGFFSSFSGSISKVPSFQKVTLFSRGARSRAKTLTSSFQESTSNSRLFRKASIVGRKVRKNSNKVFNDAKNKLSTFGSLRKKASQSKFSTAAATSTKKTVYRQLSPVNAVLENYDVLTLTTLQLQQIEGLAKKGVVQLEQLNAELMEKFQADLNTMFNDQLLSRLKDFYAEHDEDKSKENILKVAKFGMTRGLDILNEKLRLKHGVGIRIADLFSD